MRKIERQNKLTNHHHILEEKAEWTSRPESKILRQTPILVPEMYVEWHNELHANCPAVPLLGRYALTQVFNEFTPTKNTLTSLDKLLVAIDHASQHKKAHPVERDLGQLTIRALELQRPFLKAGMCENKKGV